MIEEPIPLVARLVFQNSERIFVGIQTLIFQLCPLNLALCEHRVTEFEIQLILAEIFGQNVRIYGCDSVQIG